MEIIKRPLTEKDGFKKVGLVFLSYMAFIFLYIMMSFIFNIGTIDYSSSRRDFDSSVLATWIIYYIAVIITSIPLYILVYRYAYEYLRAGITGTTSIAIWEEGMSNTLRKAGKIFLGYLVHSLVIILPLFALMIVGFFMAGLVGEEAASLMSILICFGFIAFFAWYFAYYFYVYLPCLAYMVYTRKFTNVFNVSEARNMLKGKWGTYNNFVLTNIILLVIFIATYFICFLLSIILIGIPLLMLLAVIVYYYQLVGFYYYMGETYRKAVSEK